MDFSLVNGIPLVYGTRLGFCRFLEGREIIVVVAVCGEKTGVNAACLFGSGQG